MINRLLNWLDASTCNVMAVETIKKELDKAGFAELRQTDKWEIRKGGKYYVTKNGTAIFAFVLGAEPVAEQGFRIISAHSDSPCFKIKPNAEIYGDGGLVTLNVEKYGGGILYTWFDRPLSMSGRVVLRSIDPLKPTIVPVDIEKPFATIPHLAIHFNRNVNDGNKLSVQKDMKPVVGRFSKEEIEDFKAKGGIVRVLVAEHLGIDPLDILEYELNLYPVEKSAVLGVHNEFFQSARIDDLSVAYAALEALLEVNDDKATRVMAIFDNEETGSGTKQGAASPVLRDMLERITRLVTPDYEQQDFFRALANSFMISADDAHGWHPNYSEKYDPTNHPVLGGGPVIKLNAAQKYASDAMSAAVFANVCKEAGVPCQYFVNHSDVAGGSTLGNILASSLPMRGVDMGNGVLGMHSVRETASAADHVFCIKAFTKFYQL